MINLIEPIYYYSDNENINYSSIKFPYQFFYSIEIITKSINKEC